MPQDPEFVHSKDEIRDNVRRFQKESAANPDLARRLVARIDYWVVDENEGSFAPAKLAVVRNGTLARYKLSRAHFTGGTGRAGAILNHIIGTGYEESSELQKLLAEWSTKHFGRVAIKARTFFVRLPSVERNAPKRTRETEPASSERAPHDESRRSVGTPSKVQKNQLEDAYARFTPEQMQEIIPHHNRLSNRFRKWLARGSNEAGRVHAVSAPDLGGACGPPRTRPIRATSLRKSVAYVAADVLLRHPNRTIRLRVNLRCAGKSTRARSETLFAGPRNDSHCRNLLRRCSGPRGASVADAAQPLIVSISLSDVACASVP